MENVTLTGIDLSKESFEVCCENHAGRVVRRVSLRKGGSDKGALLPTTRRHCGDGSMRVCVLLGA